MALAFGPGSQLAAQCPRIPMPDGWRAWTDSDGPIPDALTERAQAIVNDANTPLGTTESFPLPGVIALIRIEPRTWVRDASSGTLVEGCFRSSSVYLPFVPNVVPPVDSGSSGLSKAIAILTAVSLAVGTVATIAAWRNKK